MQSTFTETGINAVRVFDGDYDFGRGANVINFDTPYTYGGGNLMVIIQNSAEGTNHSDNFFDGVRTYTEDISRYRYTENNYTYSSDFLARCTFGYLDENKYTVTWKDADGNTIETDTDINAGTISEFNGTIEIPEGSKLFWTDGKFNYSPDQLPAVIGDVTFTAVLRGRKTLEVGTVFYEGDTVDLGGKYIVYNYNYIEDTDLVKSVDGEVTINSLNCTYGYYVNGFYTTDYLLFVDDNLNEKNVGIKVAGGSGTQEDPFTFEIVFDGIIRTISFVLEGETTPDDYTIRVADGRNCEDLNKTPWTYKGDDDSWTFLGWYTAEGVRFDFSKPVTADVTLYERWKSHSDYNIVISNGIANGTISVDTETAKEGDTVTLTVKPDTNYQVKSVSVNGETITPTEGVYSFTMPAEDVTVTAEFEKAAAAGSINLPENVLSKITGITKDNESVEVSSNIADESGYYTITSSYPLAFDGAEEEESDCSVTSAGNEYNYSFDLDGTQTLNVSLADLPAVTFEQQLVTGNKIQGFKYFDNSVDYNTYNDLLDGEYRIASYVPLEFVKTGENGGKLVLTDHYYAASLYQYYFTLDYSTSPTADFEVREAESSDLSLVPFTVTDYAKEKINNVSMLFGANKGMAVYTPMFDSNPPQYLQAGNYELITKDMLYISGAEVVSSKFKAADRVWQYEINVPETSANVLFDIKDITRCEMTFYNADGDELDLDNLTYTGESLQPASVKVVDREYELVEGVDYEIEYDGEWVEPSDEDDDIYPIVYITGLGDYGGTAGELSGWINAESFSVTLPENAEITNGVTLTDGKADYGTEIKFKVKDGYAVIGDVKNGETTLEPDTDGVYSITVTGDTEITAVIKKVYADGIGERLAGHSLSLNGNIGVNFYMELDSTVASNPDVYMHFTLPNGTTQDLKIGQAAIKTISSKTYYVFQCETAAKEMTDKIMAQMFSGDKSGEVYEYTVKEYADYLFKNAYEADGVTIKNQSYVDAYSLIESMVNYGAYSQIYFNHNTDALAIDGRTNTDVSAVTADTINMPYNSSTEKLPEGVTFAGANLVLESETVLNLYFTNTTGKALTFTTDNNVTLTQEPSGKYTKVTITDIAAQNLDKYVTVNVAVEDVNTEYSVKYSPMNYCYNTLLRETTATRTDALKDVMRALYLYNSQAKAYFAAQNN